MSTTTAASVSLTRIIPATPEEVFDAWTQPEQLRRWSCPEGMNVALAEVDLAVGGSFRIRMEGAEGAVHTAVGTYREIDRPRRLVYTWRWEEGEEDDGETLVTVEFRERDGATEVTLLHEGFPTRDVAVDHERGWTSCLDRLEKLFA